ncbi:hypothetical protein Tco_0506979, partial [Tanacetum coccineum]
QRRVTEATAAISVFFSLERSSIRVIDSGMKIDLVMGAIVRKRPWKWFFIGECEKPKENMAFVGGAWCDSKDSEEP